MAGVLIGAIIAVLGTVFAAMMAVPKLAAISNLRTYWPGFNAGWGTAVGIACFLLGIALAIGGWRKNTRRKCYETTAKEPAPAIKIGTGKFVSLWGVSSQGPLLEADTLENSAVENCHIGISPAPEEDNQEK